MYVLDNDTLTLALHGNKTIGAKIIAAPPYDIWLPAIVPEEQLRGRMAFLASLNPNNAADIAKIPQAYSLLLKTIKDLQNFQVLSYTSEMESLYQSWPPAIKRLGTRDCRIAATAIIHGYRVVTCNVSHFQPIPDVQIEDWSR